MPGKFINLLPPEITKPKVSAAGREPAVPVPASAVPKFEAPDILIPDNFWSNLKQFFTERPIKVRERKGAPFTQTSFGTDYFERTERTKAANRLVKRLTKLGLTVEIKK